MRKFLSIILLSALVLFTFSSWCLAAEKGGASAYTDGTITNLQQHPGYFYIPEGKTAVNFQFEYHSPQGEYYDNGVGINITDNNSGKTYFYPNLPGALDSGNYSLTVGLNPQMPGAWGSISYDLQ